MNTPKELTRFELLDEYHAQYITPPLPSACTRNYSGKIYYDVVLFGGFYRYYQEWAEGNLRHEFITDRDGYMIGCIFGYDY